jgi:F-type H+-transporting ATPase subunit delta
MRRPKLAHRYAKAFFDFSIEENKGEEVIKDIRFINNLFLGNKEFRMIICSPIIREDKKIAIMNALFQTRISDITLRYLSLILKKRRESQIDLICQEYEKLYKQSKRIITLYIRSAEALEKHIVESIRQKVKAYLDMEIETIEQINPKLIGGMQLRFNDYLIDASVQGYINNLRKELVDKSYEINF